MANFRKYMYMYNVVMGENAIWGNWKFSRLRSQSGFPPGQTAIVILAGWISNSNRRDHNSVKIKPPDLTVLETSIDASINLIRNPDISKPSDSDQ